MEPRLLTAEDLPAAERLSNMAGWNQTLEDWQRLLRLAPESCWGIEVSRVLVATATGVRRDDGLMWIGMVLTHPECRGRGYATTLMQHVIDAGREQGALRFGLDATAMGQPIYERLGFAAASEVERWRRPPKPVTIESHAEGRSIRLGNSWAEARPGRIAAFFGPCMADEAGEAGTMVEWFLAAHGQAACFWDLDPRHPYAAEMAQRYGFEPARWLVRMYLGEPDPPNPRAVAFPGFEYPPCV
jgi:GNAT superfamily N-acetyltransferase